MKFHFLIFSLLITHLASSQELQQAKRADHAKNNPLVVHMSAHHEHDTCNLLALQAKAIALEMIRNGVCTELTKSVPKKELIIDTPLFKVSKYAAARFGADVVSYSLIQLASDKQMSQVIYAASGQALTNFAQHKVAAQLRLLILQTDKNKNSWSEYIKVQVRLAAAQLIVDATKSYVIQPIYAQGLALIRAILSK